MRIIKYFHIFSFVSILLSFTACGGGEDSPLSNEVDLNTTTKSIAGYFIDAPVVNIDYHCGDIISKTQNDGKFECNKLPVIFMVGDIEVGRLYKMTFDFKVYPQDLVGVHRDDFNNSNVLKVASFLQSLDDDGDISDIINISNNIKIDGSYNLDEMSQEEVTKLLENSGIKPVTPKEAEIHLREYIFRHPIATPTPMPSPTVAPTPSPTVTPTPTPSIFNEFNTGIGGSSSFGFISNSSDNNKIWISARALFLDDNISSNSYYKNIKNFKAEQFTRLHNYIKDSKFMTFWFVDGWQESWYDLNSIQEAMDAGHIPVFSYWYFGDRLVEGMPNNQKIEKYKEDNIRVAKLLKKLHGTKMLIMEPEFNKPAILESEERQHKFASIISDAIDTIKKENPKKVLFSLSMMDIGSRGVNETMDKCGYENCSLGDKYAWSRSDIVFSDLVDKLDFISFHQMMAQFSRDYNNPGGWNTPNPRAYTDNEIGVDFLADRIANMSLYLHEKYNKPIFMPYVTIATATWDDINEDNNITDNEINYLGWENKANKFYKKMNELRPTLKANGMFGFAPMALFDNPRQDYGGYQYFMQNEYHLGIIATNSIDELDKAPDGDLYFKGNILDYIYGYISTPAPILTYTPSSTPLNLIKSQVKGKVGSKVLINGVEVGEIGADGTLDIWLDTSGDSGVKEFRVVLIDTAQNESNPLIIKIDNEFIVICYDYQFKSAKSVSYHLKISDQSLLNLVQKYLKQNIIDGVKNWIPIAGTPQGAVLSPLLANIYLHPMDVMLTNLGFKVVRYADDFVILSKTEQEAKMALEKVKEWVNKFGLTLHPDKTHIGNALIKGQGFEFLGYRFEAGKRFVRKKSLKSFRDKVRAKTKRSRSGSINEIIEDLNPMLRGWFEYFKHAYKTTFNSNDGFVRRRLRAILLVRNKKKNCFGKNINAHKQYQNIYFAKLGLFTSHEAWVVACQSR